MTSPSPDGPVGHPVEEPADLPIDPDVDLSNDPDRDVFAPRRSPRRDRQWSVLAVISLGGALGSVARYLISAAMPVKPGHFPWATFSINLTGCFALGLLMVLVLDVWPPNRYVRPFLGVGFLGGYTTFSTFAVEIRNLAGHGAWTLADAYVVNSLVGGLVAVWCGMALARLIAGLPVRRNRGSERA
ncbi:fluoride efflux transporter CrcB [Actinoallomurus rhizosphaericola]|uniref:fluoride efflux transporter CrcB n=1 Tax=Actinoallomurus rhizosphaericola TaxID=2952536 RepID=UPI0020925882|nr:fluoride efflux transporter CrcB [Actinoallomurus rhizosphaericola]MCO5997863.1 fluoride efflux transporter CrcB [Actinoallomurus rhizosphaericola]